MRSPLELDFASDRRPRPRFGAWLIVGGMLLAAAAAVQLAMALDARASFDHRLATLANTSRPQPRPATRTALDGRNATRYQAGRQIAQSLDSPWAALLGVIEVRPPSDVALLAVEPSALQRTVTITAEARSADAMLEHVALLQQDKRLAEVALVSHQQQLQAPGAPWRYQIQGSW